ncbi:hypothetical protein IJ843_01235 [bacterium]|nr:hypothetical protein [bacterium]
MPEIPKWLIAVIAVIACCWVFNQVTSFVGKVNTTVDKANSGMSREQTNLNQAENYYK